MEIKKREESRYSIHYIWYTFSMPQPNMPLRLSESLHFFAPFLLSFFVSFLSSSGSGGGGGTVKVYFPTYIDSFLARKRCKVQGCFRAASNKSGVISWSPIIHESLGILKEKVFSVLFHFSSSFLSQSRCFYLWSKLSLILSSFWTVSNNPVPWSKHSGSASSIPSLGVTLVSLMK
jgi:hypothetical protein